MYKKLQKFFAFLGPGLITGASDDDPSGIATYSQTGSMFGYSTLWRALFLIPFVFAIQYMCAKIGLVTHKGLSANIKENYPKILYFSVFILFIANTVNIGADLGAMAAALNLLVDIKPLLAIAGITLITIGLEIFIPYKKYARILKWLTFSLIAYFITALLVKQDWSLILHDTFHPQLDLTKAGMMNLVAVLGTTISPYLFFWQTSEVVEEVNHEQQINHSKFRINNRKIKIVQLDTLVGMIFANLIMYAIILTTSATLGRAGITTIETADQAAIALRPLAGNFSYLIFSIGIIGTGLLAIPILAGASAYAISEMYNWKHSLNLHFHQAPKFYLVIIASVVCGALLTLLPIKPFQLLYYTAILNGITAPPLMIVIMLLSNKRKLMGKQKNGFILNIVGGAATLVMAIAGVVMLVLQIK
ncbi:MAG: Nramp family divalent metal transporter [bacterium]